MHPKPREDAVGLAAGSSPCYKLYETTSFQSFPQVSYRLHVEQTVIKMTNKTGIIVCFLVLFIFGLRSGLVHFASVESFNGERDLLTLQRMHCKR